MGSLPSLLGHLGLLAVMAIVLQSCAPNEDCVGKYCYGMAGSNGIGGASGTGGISTGGDGATVGVHVWQAFSSSQPTGTVGTVAFDPRQPSHVYATAGSAFYRSDDSGATWAIVARVEHPISSLAFPSHSPGVLLAGSDNGVFESNDYGAHWHAKSLSGLTVLELMLHPADDRILLAAVLFEGLLRSLDGGETWLAVDLGVTPVENAGLAGDPDDPAHMWVSGKIKDDQGLMTTEVLETVDTGRSWRFVVPTTRGNLRGLTQCNTDRHYLLAAAGSKFVVTSDAGATWRALPEMPDVYSDVIAMTGPDCQTIYLPSLEAPQQSRLLRSLDGGATFSQSYTKGMEMLRAPYVFQFAIDPADPSHLLAKTGGGLFETRDGAAQWRLIPNVGVAHVTKMVAIPEHHEVWATTWGSGLWRWNAHTNLWSPNVAGEGFSDYLYTVDVSPYDSNRVVVGGWGTALLTQDGGNTYRVLFDSDNLFDVEFSPTSQQDVLAATYWSGVLRSNDAGLTWTPSADGIGPIQDGEGSSDVGARFIVALAHASNGRIYAATQNRGVFFSQDEGSSWATGPTSLSSVGVLCLLATTDATYACTASLGMAKLNGADVEFVNEGLDSLAVTGLTKDRDGTLFASSEAGVFGRPPNAAWQNLGSSQLPDPNTSVPIVYRDETTNKLIVSSPAGIYARDLHP